MKIHIPPGPGSRLIAILIRILGSTWRLEYRNIENLERARALSQQAILVSWHGRLLVATYTQRKWGVSVLASEHPDGDMFGRAVARLGWGHIKGSSTRRGAAGFRELAAVIRSGRDAAITIDGPRGPRGVAQQGATELSRMTGAVVMPISDSARPRRLFGSWDRFQLPGLFAKVVVAYGEPFIVPPGVDRNEREEHRMKLERILNELTTELDRHLGYEGSDVWPHEGH